MELCICLFDFFEKKERRHFRRPPSNAIRFTVYLGFLSCACAAAIRAIGTRNGEQLT